MTQGGKGLRLKGAMSLVVLAAWVTITSCNLTLMILLLKVDEAAPRGMERPPEVRRTTNASSFERTKTHLRKALVPHGTTDQIGTPSPLRTTCVR